MSEFVVEKVLLPPELEHIIVCGNDNYISTQLSLRVKGELDRKLFEQSVQKVVDENDGMRFVFEKGSDGKYYYSVLKKLKYDLVTIRLAGNNEEEKYADLLAHVEKYHAEADDLNNKRIWDIVLFEMGENDTILFLRTDHLISDGESNALIWAKIIAAYNGMEFPPSASFLEYLDEMREFDASPDGQQLMQNWKEKSEGYERFIKYPTGERKKSRLGQMFTLNLPKLGEYARKNKISLFHLNLFCLHASISAAFGRNDTVICIANGTRTGKYTTTIGFMTNGTLSRFRFDKNKKMSDMLIECRNNYFEADKKLKMGYRTEPCDFQISYQNYTVPKKMSFGSSPTELVFDTRLSPLLTRQFMLMAIFERGDDLVFWGSYDIDIFTPEVVEKIRKYYIAAAECLTDSDKTFEEYCES